MAAISGVAPDNLCHAEAAIGITQSYYLSVSAALGSVQNAEYALPVDRQLAFAEARRTPYSGFAAGGRRSRACSRWLLATKQSPGP